jgi:hypothetical protein
MIGPLIFPKIGLNFEEEPPKEHEAPLRGESIIFFFVSFAPFVVKFFFSTY